MPNFTTNTPPDIYHAVMDTPAAWDLTGFSSTSAVFEGGDFRLELTGTNFRAGTTPTGTITGAHLYQIDAAPGGEDSLVLGSTSALSLGLGGMADAIANTTFTFVVLPYLLHGNDVITGSADADVINGYAGSDTINAGAGNDVLYGDNLVFDGIEGDDKLNGGDGNDKLIGNGGADTMTGGAGDDWYDVTDPGDLVVEAANGGTHDRVHFSNANGLMSYTLAANVENLDLEHLSYLSAEVMTAKGNALDNKIAVVADYGAGDGNEALYGLGGSDRLYAGGGDDSLDGGTGNDLMVGGGGSDTYTVDSLSDVVRESMLGNLYGAGDGAVDTVDFHYAKVSTVSLGGTVAGETNTVVYSGIEALVLGTAASKLAYVGIGSVHDNFITGNAGANALYGLGGNDTLDGGLGNDTLQGSAGDDTLIGGKGNDILTGGLGTDTLTGGAGNDRFVFEAANTTPLGDTHDVITDFAAGDKIDLSGIDADVATAGNQLFRFIGSDAFAAGHATGQLRIENGVIYGSTDADALPEFSIAVNGSATITADSFVL